MPEELVIGEDNYQDYLPGSNFVDGEVKSHGLVPRNYSTHPQGCYAFAPAFDTPTIPQTEWAARLTQKIAEQSQLSDIRLTGNAGAIIPSRDQNGKGYCWAHSSTSACLILRALSNQPFADLSAYAVACIIKGYADEGGWGAESLDWIVANGIPTSQFWPQQSMSRSNDNPAMRQNAAIHKVTASWMDLSVQEYDRTMTFAQVATCFLTNCPVVTDFNWWSHSVCGIDLVNGNGAFRTDRARAATGKLMTTAEFEARWGIDHPVTGGFGIRIWNSWGDSWSDRGMGVLTGSHAIPDGAVAPRVIEASAA